jgi:hypothetical protein
MEIVYGNNPLEVLYMVSYNQVVIYVTGDICNSCTNEAYQFSLPCNGTVVVRGNEAKGIQLPVLAKKSFEFYFSQKLFAIFKFKIMDNAT